MIIQMYIIHANILTKLHMPEKALEYAQQGEKIAWINQDYSRLFALWVQMGSIYLKVQELGLAEEYLLKALDLQSKLKQTDLLLFALKNFAILLIIKEEWEKVEEIIARYLELSKSHEDKQNVVESLVTIPGNELTSSALFRLVSSLALRAASLALAAIIDLLITFLAQCTYILGRWFQKQTQYQEAIDLYGIAEKMVEEQGLNTLNLEIVTGLWFCYKQIGNQGKFQAYTELMYHLQLVKEEKQSFNLVDNLLISL